MRYIAFDFGDGTTTAAEYEETKTGIDVLRLLPSCNEIWSVMAIPRKIMEMLKEGIGRNLSGRWMSFEDIMEILNEGRDVKIEDKIVVGESAKHLNSNEYQICTNWKTYPTSEEGERNRVLSQYFMEKCFNLFLDQNPNYKKNGKYGIAEDQEYQVILGVPCDWNNEDVAAYLDIATEAGIPNVKVIKESQAAMFYAKRWMKETIEDKDFEEGVLLIDIGSSTTDFTYLKGTNVVKHTGLPLGARYVEMLMINRTLENDKKTYYRGESDNGKKIIFPDETPQKALEYYKKDLMEARRYKEETFTQMEQLPDVTVQTFELQNAKIIVGNNIGNNKGRLNSEYFEELLNDNKTGTSLFRLIGNISDNWGDIFKDKRDTWRGHFRTALKYVKGKWNLKDSMTVVITGGASRMQFVEKDIKNCFNDNKSCKMIFGNDGDRSFSVVKGLAWTGYAIDKIKERKEKIEKIFSGYTIDQAKDNRDDKIQIMRGTFRDHYLSAVGENSAGSEDIKKLSNDIKKLVEKEVDKIIKDGASKIWKTVYDIIEYGLKNEKDEVDTKAKINKEFTRQLIIAETSFMESLHNGIEIGDILKNKSMNELTNDIYKKFSRPNIKLDENVRIELPWSTAIQATDINIFQGTKWDIKTPDHQSFRTISYWFTSPFEKALSLFEERFTTSYVEKFLTRSRGMVINRQATSLPSYSKLLKDSIAKGLLEFKLTELASLQGAYK